MKMESTKIKKLKPKPGYKIITETKLKNVDGYTEVVDLYYYEKMTAEEMQENEDQKKKKK